MIQRIISQKGRRQAGFTLIETLVAITILMVAITGPLVFVSAAVGQALYAKDQITAFYLAQDAIEQVRNIRDTNAIQLRDGPPVGLPAPTSWLTNSNPNLDLTPCLNESLSGNKSCVISEVNAGQSSMKTCPTDNQGNPICPVLSYDKTTFLYGYPQPSTYGSLADDNSIPSLYTRTVKVTELSPNTEAQISVTIQWQTQFTNRSFTVVEDIFNWASN